MSYSVINGAVGKSPLIDKINQIPVWQVKSGVQEQMEQLVTGHSGEICQSVQFSFDSCRKEIKEQLHSLNLETGEENGVRPR